MQTKNVLNLFKLILMVLIYIHLTGCLWYSIIAIDETWIPPVDELFGDETDLYEGTFFDKDYASVYH